MRTVRRAVATAFVAPLTAVLLVPAGLPAHASAPSAASRLDPVGGPRLAERGLVVDQGTAPAPPKIKAASWLIADGETGDVLAGRDPHGRYLPASALKALTALALIPKLKPNQLVRPTPEACNVEGSKVGMTPKMQYRVSDLFHALMMVSGNDAALALAQAGGGLRPALQAMNAEAQRLQARDTLAGSVNGLDVDLGLTVKTQHTSAYDLALIMREGLRRPEFRKYAGTVHYKWPAPATKKQRKKGKKVGGYPLYSHIRLLPGEPYAYPGMIAGKNGYTMAAGQTFVGAAQRGGRTVIIALLDGETLWPATIKMLDWGFAALGKAAPVGELVDPIDVSGKDTAAGGAGAPAGTAPGGDRGDDGPDLPLLAAGGGAGLAVLVLGGAGLARRRRTRAAADFDRTG